MITTQQRSKNWNDMPYAALQLIALYNSDSVNNILDIRLVCQRWHDAATNYLPADAWRRFYDHLVKVHYQIPEKQNAEAKLPTPDTLETYSRAAHHWFSFTADARALRETFRGVENMPDSWKMQALGSVAEWEGVDVKSSRVEEVHLYGESLQGSVDFTKLPAGMQNLWVYDNQVSGSVDLTQLPVGLRELDMKRNSFSGSVDLTQLPAVLDYLDLSDNQFSGSIDLTQLPASLRSLCVNANKFSGSVDLTRLPTGLQELSLKDNQFSGSIDLTQLPAGLLSLHLNYNQFNGSLNLTRLPMELCELYLRCNEFSGSLDLAQLPEKMQQLHLTDNNFTGSTSVNNEECNVIVDDTVMIKK